MTFGSGNAAAWPWSWDMFYQPSHRAQKDAAPPPPAGSVPAGGTLPSAKTRADAAKLKNPEIPTPVSIEHGKEKYETYCFVCHGSDGKGDGPVGKKFVRPADLTGAYIQNKPDGDIYYTIEHGGMFIMPGYGDSVVPKDRWKIINYIKFVFGKKQELKENQGNAYAK